MVGRGACKRPSSSLVREVSVTGPGMGGRGVGVYLNGPVILVILGTGLALTGSSLGGVFSLVGSETGAAGSLLAVEAALDKRGGRINIHSMHILILKMQTQDISTHYEMKI